MPILTPACDIGRTADGPCRFNRDKPAGIDRTAEPETIATTHHSQVVAPNMTPALSQRRFLTAMR